MKLKHLIILITFFQIHNCFAQTSITDSLFKKLQTDIAFEQKQNDGCVILDDDTRLTYYSLILYSSVNELLKFSDDTSAAIRCLLYSGIIMKNVENNILLEFEKKSLYDTARVCFKTMNIPIYYTVYEYIEGEKKINAKKKYKDFNLENKIKVIRSKPEIVFQGEEHNIILKETLLKTDSLTCSDPILKITSFVLTINGKKLKSHRNIITEKMKRLIKKSESNDKIYFEDIKIECPDKSVRMLDASIFRIQ